MHNKVIITIIPPAKRHTKIVYLKSCAHACVMHMQGLWPNPRVFRKVHFSLLYLRPGPTMKVSLADQWADRSKVWENMEEKSISIHCIPFHVFFVSYIAVRSKSKLLWHFCFFTPKLLWYPEFHTNWQPIKTTEDSLYVLEHSAWLACVAGSCRDAGSHLSYFQSGCDEFHLLRLFVVCHVSNQSCRHGPAHRDICACLGKLI